MLKEFECRLASLVSRRMNSLTKATSQTSERDTNLLSNRVAVQLIRPVPKLESGDRWRRPRFSCSEAVEQSKG
jgi:hypothetical protein